MLRALQIPIEMSKRELYQAIRIGDLDLVQEIASDCNKFYSCRIRAFGLSLVSCHFNVAEWLVEQCYSRYYMNDTELLIKCCLKVNSDFAHQMLKYIIQIFGVIELKSPKLNYQFEKIIADVNREKIYGVSCKYPASAKHSHKPKLITKV